MNDIVSYNLLKELVKAIKCDACSTFKKGIHALGANLAPSGAKKTDNS